MMIAPDIVAKIKELELHTQKILSGSILGGGKTRQKGFGFEFDQLRAYQYGDDVRLIDWKSSARFQDNLLVRQYFEDRNRTIMVCVDISASTFFASSDHLKADIIKQVAGIVALAGAWSSDKVGMILFSDTVEKMIPPVKGHKHVHGLLQELFTHTPIGKGTNFSALFDFVATRIRGQAMIILISDFITPDISQELKKITFNKDVIAISCNDSQELVMRNIGYVWMQDLETKEIVLVNTTGSARAQVNQGLTNRISDQKTGWYKSQIDVLYLQNFDTIMHDLLVFFQKRIL